MCENCTDFQNLLLTVERDYDAALQGKIEVDSC